ncbi:MULTISPECIES: hypothetical protein [Shewanella]|uniref:Ankyrin repeat domain-containing protein n=1 Tax=Shewanella marisflavi TaxID=260364 RepID=A0ABX5WRL5_9GAMM|nr:MULTISPECIES: hypothetical protein [Shewanella]QDF75796.1 hypothetical protein FGA12_11865 [Shewanella marisflavi]
MMLNSSVKRDHLLLLIGCIVVLFTMLGCSSRQHPVDYIQSNQHVQTDEKIAYLTSFRSLSRGNTSAYLYSRDDSNDYCNTLLDCAIYTRDYSLAKWLLESLDNFYVRKSMGLFENDLEYYPIASPLVHDLSDEEASQFLAMMLDKGFSPNRCSQSITTPLILAIDKGYLKSARILLEHKASYRVTECKSTVISDGMNGMKTVQRSVEGPLAYAILTADETNPVTYQMITLLLDYKEDFTRPSNYRSICNHDYSSVTLYAYCAKKYQVEQHIADYYRNTDRVDDRKRNQLLASISEYKDLSRRSAQQKRQEIAAAKQYEQQMKALLDAGDSDSTFRPYELASSVAEQMGSNVSSSNVSSSNVNLATNKRTTNSSSIDSDTARNKTIPVQNEVSNALKDAYIYGEVRCNNIKYVVVTQTFKIACNSMTNCISVADQHYDRIFKKIRSENAMIRKQDENFCSVIRLTPVRSKSISENIRSGRIKRDQAGGVDVEYYTY